jgi:hypothetical protein
MTKKTKKGGGAKRLQQLTDDDEDVDDDADIDEDADADAEGDGGDGVADDGIVLLVTNDIRTNYSR